MENSFVEIIQLVFFPTRFKSLYEKLFMSCSREHFAHKLPHHRFDIRMFILFIERAHTRAHTLAREIAAKRIEETILSTGNDTRGEFPTGTRSTRL